MPKTTYKVHYEVSFHRDNNSPNGPWIYDYKALMEIIRNPTCQPLHSVVRVEIRKTDITKSFKRRRKVR